MSQRRYACQSHSGSAPYCIVLPRASPYLSVVARPVCGAYSIFPRKRASSPRSVSAAQTRLPFHPACSLGRVVSWAAMSPPCQPAQDPTRKVNSFLRRESLALEAAPDTRLVPCPNTTHTPRALCIYWDYRARGTGRCGRAWNVCGLSAAQYRWLRLTGR